MISDEKKNKENWPTEYMSAIITPSLRTFPAQCEYWILQRSATKTDTE